MSANKMSNFLDQLESEETAEYLREKYEYFFNGENPDASNATAIYYLKKLADKFEDVEALRTLGEFYDAGTVVEEDYELAKHYFERAMAKGDVESIVCLARLYYYGLGMDKDYDMALSLYRKAADMGHVSGQLWAGKMYMLGQGCDKSENEARKYLTLALNQGSDSAKKLLDELGDEYNWIREDEKLNEYAKKSEVELNKLLEADDMYAIYTIANKNIEKNDIKSKLYAVELYERSVRLGLFRGLVALALCYMEGNGTVKDVDKARKMLDYAKEQGCYIALFHLGQLYENYIKEENNLKTAIEYYQQGAKRGEQNAINRLKFLDVGINDKVPNNINEWYKKIIDGKSETDSTKQENDESVSQEDNVYELLKGFGINIDPTPISNKNDEYVLDEDLIEKLFERIRKESKPKKINCKKTDVEAWNKEQTKIKSYGKYSINKLKNLVEENDPYAMIALANIYYDRNDDSLSEDRYNAVNLYAKSAYCGLISAFNSLGYCYDVGGVYLMCDCDKAIELYEYAACHGCLFSFTNLAGVYSLGHKVEEDMDKAIDLYKKAADFGSVEALNMLGFEYMGGYAKAENEWSGISIGLYYSNEAARKGHVGAQVRLAIYYDEHNRTEEAIQWLAEAVRKDDEQALLLLGDIYERPNSVHFNYKNAFNKYKRAADLCNPWACVKCGEYYLYGKGVEVDYKKAIEFFNKASLPDADAYLGICQLNGYGVPKNVQQGFDTLTAASHQGSDIASGELGMIYYEGKYTKTDYKEALMYFNKILYPERENPKYTKARKAIEDMKCPHCGEFAGKVEKKSLFTKKIYCSKCDQLWD